MGEQAVNRRRRLIGVIERNPHVRDCDMIDESIDKSSQNSPLNGGLTEVLCGRLAPEKFLVPGDKGVYFILK